MDVRRSADIYPLIHSLSFHTYGCSIRRLAASANMLHGDGKSVAGPPLLNAEIRN